MRKDINIAQKKREHLSRMDGLKHLKQKEEGACQDYGNCQNTCHRKQSILLALVCF